jgi:hypothetical protein
MALVTTRPAKETRLQDEIAKAIRKLGKDVVRVNYSFDTDSTGDEAVYFRVVLTDASSREDKLSQTADRIEAILSDGLGLQEKWGLLAYFSYRNESEQKQLRDPKWA